MAAPAIVNEAFIGHPLAERETALLDGFVPDPTGRTADPLGMCTIAPFRHPTKNRIAWKAHCNTLGKDTITISRETMPDELAQQHFYPDVQYTATVSSGLISAYRKWAVAKRIDVGGFDMGGLRGVFEVTGAPAFLKREPARIYNVIEPAEGIEHFDPSIYGTNWNADMQLVAIESLFDQNDKVWRQWVRARRTSP